MDDKDPNAQVTHIVRVDPQTAQSGENQPPQPPQDAALTAPDPEQDKVLARIRSMTRPSMTKIDGALGNAMIERIIQEKLANARSDIVNAALEIATDAAPMINEARKKDENDGNV